MTIKTERILTREAFIILGFLIVFFLTTFYTDMSPLIEKINFLSFYGYPFCLVVRLLMWWGNKILKFFRNRSRHLPQKKYSPQRKPLNIEEVATRELFVLLVFLIVFFLSTFYVDYHPIIEKINMVSFYGYPLYLGIRMIFWILRILRG